MDIHFSENGKVTACGYGTATLTSEWSDKASDATCERCKYYIAQKKEFDARLKQEGTNGARG